MFEDVWDIRGGSLRIAPHEVRALGGEFPEGHRPEGRTMSVCVMSPLI